MENRSRITVIIIRLVIACVFALAVPSLAMGEEAASSSEQSSGESGTAGSQTSGTSDTGEDQSQDENSIGKKSDGSSDITEDQSTEKEEKAEEEPDAGAPEGMAMGMTGGGAGESSGDGVYSSAEAVNIIYTGAATYKVPIAVPPGRNGLQPDLSLFYRSYSSNGWLGAGWHLDLGSVRRSLKRGLDYSANDYVYTKDGSITNLVSRSGDWGANYYGAEIENEFTKYYFDTSTSGWVITKKDGTKYYLGSSDDSRQKNGNDIFSWCLDKVEDTNGNFMTITYTKDSGQIYPDRISYTAYSGLSATKYVDFITETRDDQQISYLSHSAITTAKRLASIEVYAETGNSLVRRYDFTYGYNDTDDRSRLEEIIVTGADDESTLPPITFSWFDGGDGKFGTVQTTYLNEIEGKIRFGDLNSDGNMDFIKYFAVVKQTQSNSSIYAYVFLSDGDGTFTERDLLDLGPCDSDQVGVRLGDIDGDGKEDIISNGLNGNVNAYLSNGDGTFRGPFTTLGPPTDDVYLVDINGDGMADLIRHKIDGTVYSSLSEGDGHFQYNYGIHRGPGGRSVGYINFADINGDGYMDLIRITSSGAIYIYLAEGDGTFESTKSGSDTFYAYLSFGDVNGDGLTDLIRSRSDGTVQVSLSLGTGSFSSQIETEGEDDTTTSVGDVNGDGLADIVQTDSSGVNYTFISAGDGTFLSYVQDTGGPEGTGKVFLVDVNGDGRADMIKSGGNCICVALAQGDGPADQIESIVNNLGGTTTLSYTKSSSYTENKIPYVIYPVSSIERDDGVGVISTFDYTYSGGLYNYDEREFRGFAYVKKTNPDVTTIETWYHQDKYKQGLVKEIQGKEPEAEDPFKKITITYNEDSIGSSVFVRVDEKKTEFWDNQYVYMLEQYTFNTDNGNLLQVEISGTNAESVTQDFLYYNYGAWTWRKTRETLTGSTSGKVRENYYTHESGTGNMLTKESWLDTGDNPETSMDYDTYGNLTSVTDPRGNETTTAYDSTTHTYPTVITRPTTSGTNHISENEEYDYRFGRVTTFRDENGNRTYYDYDAFGRLIQVDYPDGGQTVYEYHEYDQYQVEIFPRYTVKKVKEDASHTIDAYKYFDGFGRSIQTLTFGEDNQTIVTRQYYDEMGQKYLTEGPFFSTGVGYPKNPSGDYPYTETTYDYRQRPSEITSPDGTHGTITTSYDYSGLETTITDPDGREKTEKRDYLGRIIRVTEHTETGDKYTYYGYNAAGDLLEVTDSANNETTIQYDTLGRKENMTDPDMGFWEYTYDENGNLLTQTDAKDQTITFQYDNLNRVVSKTYSTQDSSAAYVYDQADNGIGRLYSMTKGSVSTVYDEYDEMGRVTSITKTIPGDTARNTTYEYDLSGKIRYITHPDSYIVENIYYPGTGLLYRVTGTGGAIHAECEDYEPTGKIGKITHQNGAQTVYTYDPESTRLTKIVTTKSATTIQDREYAYTAAGDVETITDNKTDITYEYEYDYLHRLVSEDSSDAYPTMTYSYNAIGNITSRSVGNTVYSYTQYDTYHKHAVGTVNVNSQNYNFSYDDNGNMTSGYDLTNLGQVATRTIQWNADNMPTSISHSVQGTTTFTYDGGNVRVKKVSGSIETYYVGKDFEIKKAGGSPDYIKYIFAGNLRVAKVSSGNGTHYFHKDHLGSSTAMTDSNGSVSEATEYMPFGSQRAYTGSEVSNYKFTDQELDPESGLYNYDARLYDPVIGRFISADPVVPYSYNPQSLNRYSYCRNNPLIYIDPTGNVDIGQLAMGVFERGKALGTAFIGSIATFGAFSANPVLGIVVFIEMGPVFYCAYLEAEHAYHDITESFETDSSKGASENQNGGTGGGDGATNSSGDFGGFDFGGIEIGGVVEGMI